MKTHHAEQVEANVLVLRHAVDQLLERGPSPVEGAEAMLARVEAWVAGEPVEADDLREASQLVYERSRKLNRFDPVQAKWACAGIGNSCWMALKPRGWRDGNRTTMDAAIYTLTSLLPKKAREERDAVRPRLEAMRAAALEAAIARVEATPKKKAPKRKTKTSRLRRPKGLEQTLGVVAARWMERCRTRVDPRHVGSDAELKALLKTRGAVASPALLELERHYGGLVMREAPDEETRDWFFGAHHCLTQEIGDWFGDRGLVPVAASPNDLHYYLDADGAGWGFDAIQESEPSPFAVDGHRLVARIALSNIHFRRRIRRKAITLEGARGKVIAEELGVPRIDEASGGDWEAWGDARRLVFEQTYDGARMTAVSGPGAKRFAPG